MPRDGKHILEAREAAQIIYRTAEPSGEEIDKVRLKLAKGVLKRSAKGGWTTTLESVTNYVAQRQSAKDGHADLRKVGRPLRHVYRELLRDWCWAVLLRRRQANRSRAFRASVTAGQIACLAILAGVFYWSVRFGVNRAPLEHAIIASWISQNQGKHRIVQWYPVDTAATGDTSRVRVRYEYHSGKPILTDRVFCVRDSQVVDVSQSE